MPPRRRTDPGRRTPPTSPTTSTSHASTDQHHRLRHAGPSIGTRAPPKPGHSDDASENHPKKKKLLAEVPPPGYRTPFTKFLYTLLFVVLLLVVWYVYGMVTLLARLKEDVGWWGIISGDPGGMRRWESLTGWRHRFGTGRGRTDSEKSGDVEASLNALADALGIPPLQVASAVKPLVPPASLTNMASKSERTGGSEAVRVLFEDTMQGGEDHDTAWVAKEFEDGRGGEATDGGGGSHQYTL